MTDDFDAVTEGEFDHMEVVDGLATLAQLLHAISGGPAPLVASDQVDELMVSTIHAHEGWYETAIVDADGRAHPVERYNAEPEARAGHAAWVERAATLTTITELGYGSLPPKEITLREVEQP